MSRKDNALRMSRKKGARMREILAKLFSTFLKQNRVGNRIPISKYVLTLNLIHRS